MERRDLLLEIGIEEVPAKFMPPALEQLENLAAKGLEEARLDYDSLKTYGTPRRLALYVTGLATAQRDLAVKARGPSAKVAFDSEGNPTKALLGFAKGQGVDIADIIQEEVNGVPYVFANRVEAGLAADQVLPQLLKTWINGLSFPKPMRWGYGDMRFARPIRWLVALFGSAILPLEIEGVAAGNASRGHRFLTTEPVMITEPGQYLARLEQAFVIADQDRRRDMIWSQVTRLAAVNGGQVLEDQDLLEEVTYLVEYPTALYGNIDQAYMDIPGEVLTTAMKEHQRYFPVVSAEGSLLPGFITVRSGNDQHLDNVRQGNEKVLRARLDDAAFFWTEDQKADFTQQTERLAKVVFLEKLGTIKDRVERIVQLSAWLADHLSASGEVRERAQRAASLAKADLVSHMVYEFPELQGIMGEKYALLAGEDKLVAQAIREHYQPRFAGDELPQTSEGTMVALADKIDAIVGCFAVGIIPTGSQDPYALRRQAQAISLIVMEGALPLVLPAFVQHAYQMYQAKFQLDRSLEEVQADVLDFFKQRLRHLLTEAGVSYDVIDAVLAAGIDQPADVGKRALALATFRKQEDFGALLTAYTRAANLAQKGEGGAVKEALLLEQPEKDLWANVQQSRQQIVAAGDDYAAAFQVMADLRPVVDAFFDAVMVMAEDAAVRQTRLALLDAVVGLMDGIADLSKIVE